MTAKINLLLKKMNEINLLTTYSENNWLTDFLFKGGDFGLMKT